MTLESDYYNHKDLINVGYQSKPLDPVVPVQQSNQWKPIPQTKPPTPIPTEATQPSHVLPPVVGVVNSHIPLIQSVPNTNSHSTSKNNSNQSNIRYRPPVFSHFNRKITTKRVKPMPTTLTARTMKRISPSTQYPMTLMSRTTKRMAYPPRPIPPNRRVQVAYPRPRPVPQWVQTTQAPSTTTKRPSGANFWRQRPVGHILDVKPTPAPFIDDDDDVDSFVNNHMPDAKYNLGRMPYNWRYDGP